MSIARQFGAITKVEDQADGTIKVWGIASAETRDGVGELITAEAMKGALPDYERFPALREMHEPSAAGKVLEAEVDGTGATQICALVVDPIAISKVRAGVYAGFSVGGKVLKRDATDRSIITALKLVEISLVDSPCNPDAVINMWKADMSDYTPSGDEVVAKAKSMADEAGTKKYRDFLFKAREALITEALAELGDDEPDEEIQKVEGADATVETPAVEAVAETPPAAEAEAGAEATATEGEDGKEAAAPVDPTQALQDAIDKAAAAVDVAAAPPAIVLPTQFDDMAKAGTALSLIAKTVQTDDLTKGLWFVERSARLLECIGELAMSITWEERDEGDSASPLPTMAIDLVNRIKAFVIAITNEEVAELITSITSNLPDFTLTMIDGCCDEPDIIILANDIVDLVKADTDLMAKAGARNSKTDAAMIQQSHDHMAKLGATCDSGNCSDDAAAEKVALAAENERLSKALTDAAPAVVELTKKFETTIADLTKRLEQVESEPAAPKTAGGPLRAITKGEDISPNGNSGQLPIDPDEFRKMLNEMPEHERGQLLLRVALSNPTLMQTARAAA